MEQASCSWVPEVWAHRRDKGVGLPLKAEVGTSLLDRG